MATRTFISLGFTPVAVAAATNFTNLGYMALQGGSSTQLTLISEVLLGGLASASAPTPMALARDSTIGATLTALTTGESDEPDDPATAALAAPVSPFTQSTTKPQRSGSKALMGLGFNAFGGIINWQAAPGAEKRMLGNTASLGEISLSSFTGGTPGLITGSIVYETK